MPVAEHFVKLFVLFTQSHQWKCSSHPIKKASAWVYNLKSEIYIRIRFFFFFSTGTVHKKKKEKCLEPGNSTVYSFLPVTSGQRRTDEGITILKSLKYDTHI